MVFVLGIPLCLLLLVFRLCCIGYPGKPRQFVFQPVDFFRQRNAKRIHSQTAQPLNRSTTVWSIQKCSIFKLPRWHEWKTANPHFGSHPTLFGFGSNRETSIKSCQWLEKNRLMRTHFIPINPQGQLNAASQCDYANHIHVVALAKQCGGKWPRIAGKLFLVFRLHCYKKRGHGRAVQYEGKQALFLATKSQRYKQLQADEPPK